MGLERGGDVERFDFGVCECINSDYDPFRSAFCFVFYSGGVVAQYIAP